MSREIIYDAVCRYLTKEQIMKLDEDLLKVAFVKSDGRFTKLIFSHFDINRFKDNPVFEEDIMLYNYFMYDYKGKAITYRGLLPKYNKFLKKNNL